MKAHYFIHLSYLLIFSVYSAEPVEKKVIKEEDLASMFTKEAKFSSEAVDQDSIDKEMAVIDEASKEASFGSVLLLDECGKLPDENAYQACKKRVLNKK